MLQNQDAFSLAALVDRGAGVLGLHTGVGNTFLGNLFLGNDVMGVSSLLLNMGTPDGTLASGVSQSISRGLGSGIGQPLQIGGNKNPALQKLFPRVGRRSLPGARVSPPLWDWLQIFWRARMLLTSPLLRDWHLRASNDLNPPHEDLIATHAI
jgi:hypothetical protein